MSVVVNCNCGKKFKAKDEMAGKKVRCPDCKSVIRIPGGAGDSAVAVAAQRAPAKSKSASPSKPVIDEESVLLKYEAVQKKKQLDAESEAAYKLEQQKIIESYDQLAGKASPADLAKKKKKDELTETGVKKPTVATKAADATGSFFSNSFVKYVLLIALLGGATYGSVQLVAFITKGVDRNVASVVPREERVNQLIADARIKVAEKKYDEAAANLDEVIKLDPSKKENRTVTYLRDQIKLGRAAAKP